jgi:Protease subunit of ATP-dependent Clp proteases
MNMDANNVTVVENGASLYEQLYKRLWNEKRILYYNLPIEDSVTDLLITPIMLKNMEEKDTPIDELKPIEIWLNSDGGDVFVALTLIKTMQESRIPINVRVLNKACSAGLLITLAGKKRYANKDSIFLLHDGEQFISNSSGKARDTMKFLESVEKKVDNLILSRTKLTEDEYEKIKRLENWYFADDALNLGFIDVIE